MAEDKKISQLNSASAFNGAEKFELVQGGLNVAGTPEQMKNYIGGITREYDRTFSASLLFDKNEIHYAPHTLTGDTTFTVDPDSNDFTDPSTVILEIITDGTHAVFFEPYNAVEGVGFKYIPASSIQSGETPPAGTYAVMFVRWNSFSIANWVVPSSESANLTPLSAPANFTATPDASSGDTEIDLAWDNVADAASYAIYRSLTGLAGSWGSPIATPAAGSTSYANTGLDPATQYYYQIIAVGDLVTHTNSQPSEATAMTEDTGDVTAPVATFTPADSATNIPMNRRIVIDFNESIRDADGVTAITSANVADYLTVKEDDGAGSDIAFTATINGAKTQIIIEPVTSWGDTQAVFVEVDGIEDVNGNEAAAQDATFTTNDYTEFNGTSNFVRFGDILDSLFCATDVNFWLEISIDEYSLVGTRVFIAKDAQGVNRTFVLYQVDDSIRFGYYVDSNRARYIQWANCLDGDPHTLVLKYDGSIDTNDGLDRVTLEIDTVVQGSKTLVATTGVLDSSLHNTTSQLAVFMNVASDGSPVLNGYGLGWAKDFIIRSNAGATVEINIPNLKEGTDTSGNGRNGTWV